MKRIGLWPFLWVGLFLLIFSLTWLESRAPELAATTLPIDVAQLENGMHIMVVTDRRAPVVTHMVWYRFGAADEPEGKSGIAHFFEHLMFKGTREIAAGEFSKIIARLGGQDNAFTSHDFTAYYQRIAKDKLATVMQMEADRMHNLTVDEANVATEKQVVLEERSQRLEGNPTALLGEKMRAKLYDGHPYAIPIIGWREDIEGLTQADALDFYQEFYAPNHAALVVVGDVRMDEVLPLAETYYGIYKARPQANMSVSATAVLHKQDKPDTPVILEDTRARQHIWQRLYALPQWQPEDAAEFAALDVLISVLANPATGRLTRALKRDNMLITHSGGWSDDARRYMGEAGLYAIARTGDDYEKIAQHVDREIAFLQTETIGNSELQIAITRLLADAIFARDNQQDMAYILGEGFAIGRTPQDVLAWPTYIAAVTPKDVRAAAQRFLRKDYSVTGYILAGETQ